MEGANAGYDLGLGLRSMEGSGAAEGAATAVDIVKSSSDCSSMQG